MTNVVSAVVHGRLATEEGAKCVARAIEREGDEAVRCLMDTPAAGGQELALGTFAANKDIYHPICRKMVASDMAKAMDRKKEAASSEEYRAGLSFGLGVAAAVAVVALVAKARS